MNSKSPQPPEKISEQSVKLLELSSAKNNRLLVFFYLSALYIFISVLTTTDLMLLLPTDTFKMPLIGFDLNLIYFYILAPVLLFLLHFNILFNYHEHLQKLHNHIGRFDVDTMDSSMYNYVYIAIHNGSIKGMFIRILLRLFIYIFPLIVFVSIYHSFAAYHHEWITLGHLFIVVLDAGVILWSIYENETFYKQAHGKTVRKISSILFFSLTLGLLILESSYYYLYFRPLTQPYNADLIAKFENKNWYAKTVCEVHRIFLNPDRNKPIDCFPRIMVVDKDIVKISKSSIYIPSLFAKDEDRKPEKNLILEYGARVNLANRNLRYVDLEGCILTRADMHNTQLQAANLKKSHLQAVKFDDAQLQDANMTEAELQKTVFFSAQLQRASFMSANLTNTYFDESNLSSATMRGAYLDHTSFYKTDLDGVKLANVILHKDVDYTAAKNVQLMDRNKDFKNIQRKSKQLFNDLK